MTALAFPRGTPFWERVTKTDSGCWEWAGSHHSHGYGWAYSRGKMRLAHRVAWEMFNGPIPDGMDVCHHCDNPPCIQPDHLFLERRPLVKMLPSDHAAIVERVKAGEYASDISREYGVTRQRIQQILGAAGVSTLGTKPRHRKSPRLERMVAMFTKGYSFAEIAADVGSLPGVVRNALAKAKRGLDVPYIQPRHLTYPHGTNYGYKQGCRCDQCRQANTVSHREYVAGRRAAS